MKTLNKSVIAVMVMASFSTVAHASNVDVNKALATIHNAQVENQNTAAYTAALSAYNNLNARDRLVVDKVTQTHASDYTYAALAKIYAKPANVPAGWVAAKTYASLETKPAAHVEENPFKVVDGKSVYIGSIHSDDEQYADAPDSGDVSTVSVAISAPVSKADQLKQLNAQMFQAIKLKSVAAQQMIHDQITAVKALPDVTYSRDAVTVPQVTQGAEQAPAPMKTANVVAQVPAPLPQLTPPTPNAGDKVPSYAVPQVQQQTPQATPPKPQLTPAKLVATPTPVTQLVPVAPVAVTQKTPVKSEIVQTIDNAPQQMPVSPVKNEVAPKPVIKTAPLTIHDGKDGKDGVTTVITKVDNSAVESEAAQRQQADYTQRRAIVTNSQAIDVQQGEILSHSRAIASNSASIAQNSQKIEKLTSQQDTDRKAAKAGTANALAVSGLHYVDKDNSIAIGAGTYEGQNAGSFGYRHKFSENVAATVAASQDSNGGTGAAASLAIGW